jgi:hypothetical protein
MRFAVLLMRALSGTFLASLRAFELTDPSSSG